MAAIHPWSQASSAPSETLVKNLEFIAGWQVWGLWSPKFDITVQFCVVAIALSNTRELNEFLLGFSLEETAMLFYLWHLN